MLKVDYQEIKRGIVGDKFQLFLIEFPEAKTEIEKYRAQPSCGTCERTVLPKLFANPKYDEKIKLIYGPDITIDKTLPPMPPPYVIDNKVFKIPLKDWETWFLDFTKPNPDMQIRFMTTFLVNDTVVCSAGLLVKAPNPT